MLPNFHPFVYIGIKIRTPETLLLQCMQAHIAHLECYLKQTTITRLDPKSKYHVTCQGSDSRSFHIICRWAIPCPAHPESMSLSNCSFIRKWMGRERGFPGLFGAPINTSAAEELGTPPLWDSFLCHPWMAWRGCRARSHCPVQEGTALAIDFQAFSIRRGWQASRCWGIYQYFSKWPSGVGNLVGFLVFPTSSQAKCTPGWSLSWYLNPTSSNRGVKNKVKRLLEMEVKKRKEKGAGPSFFHLWKGNMVIKRSGSSAWLLFYSI